MYVRFRYFKKKAIGMPSCLAAYPQSLSHLRRNRYSNLLRRFSMESQPETLLEHTQQEHLLASGQIPLQEVGIDSRSRANSCHDATSAKRALKAHALPLANLPEIVVLNDNTCSYAAASPSSLVKDSARNGRGGSWKDRFPHSMSTHKKTARGKPGGYHMNKTSIAHHQLFKAEQGFMAGFGTDVKSKCALGRKSAASLPQSISANNFKMTGIFYTSQQN